MYRKAAAILTFVLLATPAHAQSLRGSLASMIEQNSVATRHDYTFLTTGRQVRSFVDDGYLVRIERTATLDLANVSYPYARPQVRTFLNRLSVQYYASCGMPLVVTSLTRPKAAQPRNASSRSVHPTGMAIDLRIHHAAGCKSWLEDTLLSLERQGVLEATRERRPPHYHVALYPEPYETYVASLMDQGVELPSTAMVLAAHPAPQPATAVSDTVAYRVRRGDSLWTIARRQGTTVQQIKSINNLTNSRIYAGQVLALPAR